tara:strand:+ start:454 stop:2046 length:1593 start_codon:yes stop_codon:yes gene_type:complete
MNNESLLSEISRRRTFAIISHPDAGKTTLTERFLHYGGAIQLAGTVRARKSGRYATSDWMKLEKERGISVTSSVMQFLYKGHVINLLDTPGHEDFSEDTYRTLTAVDSALMVVDIAKGVEARTIKLMDVCRLRDTPIMTFVNKLDRDGRDPIEVVDEIESVLGIACAPLTWPIGSGRHFRGLYRIFDDSIHLYSRVPNSTGEQLDVKVIKGLKNPELDEIIGEDTVALREEIELIREAGNVFSVEKYLSGGLTPVYFGSALSGEGTKELIDSFVKYAPQPGARASESRVVESSETPFTGFVFKVQANMDPSHHDRVAFLRITSGMYQKGMRLFQVRTEKSTLVHNAITFLASRREAVDIACAGDIIGLHNHGKIRIGDTFTEGEKIKFTGIPNFSPDLFRRVRLVDPLRGKALNKGLDQLSEEGAAQVFRPLSNNEIILGAVGVLQFDVVAHRLQHEYGVDCRFEFIPVATARWVISENNSDLEEFTKLAKSNLALDASGALTYIAPNIANLYLVAERWPKIEFSTTREL